MTNVSNNCDDLKFFFVFCDGFAYPVLLRRLVLPVTVSVVCI